MQPPGGGAPPGDRKAPLPPPFGGRPQGGTNAPSSTQPLHGAGPLPQPPPSPHAAPAEPAPAPQQPYQPPPAQQPYQPPQHAAQPAKLPPAPAAGPTPFPPPSQLPPAGPAGPPPTGGRLPLPALHQTPHPQAYRADSSGPFDPGAQSLGAFLHLSVRRAYRLRIEPDEVTPQERAELELAGVTDPTVQAFLAWRRSILFAVAVLLVPLILLKTIEIFSGGGDLEPAMKSAMRSMRGLQAVPLLAEVAFCALAWVQLKRWTDWRRQRRVLAIGWAAFFLAPFVIYLYPMRSIVEDAFTQGAGAEQKGAVLLMGVIYSVQAMMTLAPKAVSLIPGLVRAALVSKFLFPGSAAPGWLVVMAAPIYALFVYVVLFVPYQITGSGWFVAAILSITVAAVLLARGGFDLARPMTRDQAIASAQRARTSYLIAMVVTAVFLLAALGSMVSQLDFGALSVFTLVGTFLINVWILTLITTDVVITNLDRARGLSAGTGHLVDESNRQLAHFVGAADHAGAADHTGAGDHSSPPATNLPT